LPKPTHVTTVSGKTPDGVKNLPHVGMTNGFFVPHKEGIKKKKNSRMLEKRKRGNGQRPENHAGGEGSRNNANLGSKTLLGPNNKRTKNRGRQRAKEDKRPERPQLNKRQNERKKSSGKQWGKKT